MSSTTKGFATTKTKNPDRTVRILLENTYTVKGKGSPLTKCVTHHVAITRYRYR